MTYLHGAIATATAAVFFSAGAALAQGTPPAAVPDPGQTPPRVISVDYRAMKGPRSQTFRECVGAGRVGEGLRADWQAQLKLCRDELGFEHLRCHGLLHDELGIYHEDTHGNPLYNFQYIDMVYDYMVSIGVRPFVEIGFTPNDLATIPTSSAGPDGMADDPAHPGHKRRVSVFWWKSNVTPPKDWPKWDALIAALVQHWTARYGADEVKQWPFEVWNEPNHVAFWSPNDNAQRMQEYFNLYAHTAQAIKSVNPAYRVGGPATAGPAYIGELIAYCTQNNVPLDLSRSMPMAWRAGRAALMSSAASRFMSTPARMGLPASPAAATTPLRSRPSLACRSISPSGALPIRTATPCTMPTSRPPIS